MKTWAPIDSAPKDGEEILVFDTTDDRIRMASYDDGEWLTDAGTYLRRPMLWMPLPEPPSD